MPVWSEAGCRARAGGLPSGGGSERGRTACGLVAPAGLALATGWPARARSVLRSRVERSAGSARVSCPVPALCARVGAYWPFARVGARWPFACVCSAGHSRAGRRLPALRARRHLLALRAVGALWRSAHVCPVRASEPGGRCARVGVSGSAGPAWVSAGGLRALGASCVTGVCGRQVGSVHVALTYKYTPNIIWLLDFLCNT